ncbi:hypothetical protein [Phenylobacterium kunshanense]|uniref:Uncharacterized protein n=1 Tax=Phenylobacterium kunshanense TaxID=1445034 RepID=A0A328B9I6_9CAUL|nr:hypothetical protein [Phenylobacterium kunshanense]RAK63355.1 hypothetical protein DJ019_16650 [Phenylobacterium kunshanense]
MPSPRPQPPSTLADARRVALVSVLAYMVAIALVVASLPMFLDTAEPLQTVARVPAVFAPEPPR